MVVLAVSDTGAGLAVEDLMHTFERASCDHGRDTWVSLSL